MKRTSTRLLALLVCLLLLLTAVPVSAFAAERVTTCGGDCPFYPTIIVPGLGQSSVIVTNDDGTPKLDKNGNKSPRSRRICKRTSCCKSCSARRC